MNKALIALFFVFVLANTTGLYQKFYPLAEEIISHMTLDQKIGQTIQIDFV